MRRFRSGIGLKKSLINTHLSFNSEDARVRQVEAMLPYITDQTTTNPAKATIITGDFNATPNSEPIGNFTHTGNDTFFFDTYREINPFSPGYTVPANNPDAKIDYIFYKSIGGLEIINSKIIMDTTYNGVDYISDHLGVLTVFSEKTSNSGLRFNPYLEFEDALVWTQSDTLLTVINPGTENTEIYSISRM